MKLITHHHGMPRLRTSESLHGVYKDSFTFIIVCNSKKAIPCHLGSFQRTKIRIVYMRGQLSTCICVYFCVIISEVYFQGCQKQDRRTFESFIFFLPELKLISFIRICPPFDLNYVTCDQLCHNLFILVVTEYSWPGRYTGLQRTMETISNGDLSQIFLQYNP